MLNLFKLILTLGVIWPLSSWFVTENARYHMVPYHPLPDMGQKLLSPYRKAITSYCHIKDILSMVPSIWGLLWLNYNTFSHFVNYMCGLVILRCIFFNMTILPTSSPNVYMKSNLEKYLTGGLYDLFPSGHTLYFYAAARFLCYHNMFIGNFLTELTTLFIGIVSVGSLDHYTIDVLSAIPFVWAYERCFLI